MKTNSLHRAIVTLSLKITEEVARRKRAERTLEHESKALQEALSEIAEFKREHSDHCWQMAQVRAELASFRSRINLAASLFPARYRKQIQAILEAK